MSAGRRVVSIRGEGERASGTVLPKLGGRVSLDQPFGAFAGPTVILPPADHQGAWRRLELGPAALGRVSPATLIEHLADLSPEVSRAVFDFQRLCNPGWEVRALRPGGKDEDARGKAKLDAFLDLLDDRYGTVDVIWGRLFMAAYLRGALMAELVLDERGREMVDLATPDPASARFRRAKDPQRGDIWQLGQWQGAKFVDLDRPTIRYVPVDPFPGSPYGRAPAAPALFPTLFLLGLLHDIRRVVAQQGYPRLDIEIDLDGLAQLTAPEDRDDPERWAEVVAEAIAEVERTYAGLQPDDAYVHVTFIKLNKPVGAADASSLGGIGGLIETLERMAVRALKLMPLLMGTRAGGSEANANREWEVQAAGIKAIQHLVESPIERLLSLGLQAGGIQARVELRFAELRSAELLRDEQTAMLQITNARRRYDAGWISQDAAAQQGAGVEAADAPEPRAPDTKGAGPGVTDPAGTQPGDGGNRATPARGRGIVPVGAGFPLPPLSEEVAIGARDKEAISAAWDEALEDHAGLLDAEVIDGE